MNLNKYIGDRKFYRTVLKVSVPMMIQNGITNFVNLLDNIMVGSLSMEAMSGVSIVNQFIFVFNLMIFGAISAAGIFTAQYHGIGNREGERDTFRFKMIINVVAGILGIAVFALFDDMLISGFLHEGSAEGDLTQALAHGKEYLGIILIGLLPYSVSQAYASTMRETGETFMPMIASIVAVATNFILNLVLIFGLLGLPALGVSGAAIATTVSRYAELAVLILWGHSHTQKCGFLVGAFRSLAIPRHLVGQITVKGFPLMANEFFWSLSVTMRNQCYSVHGLDVVAAQNISSTIFNVFNVVYMSLGVSVSIIVGNLLGAGKLEEARDSDRKLIAFSTACGVLIGMLMAVTSPLFPRIYEATDAARSLATYMMIVSAITMPFCSYANAAYFTLRSGGKVSVTLLFDSVFMWVIVMPLAFGLSLARNAVDIRTMYAVCSATEMLKALFGYILLRRGTWVRQLVTAEGGMARRENNSK
ncbi:MAG: MATE family efflux transporter [Clostridia bacterium]|nr:MATE family efflux transporter [Clostridia bacterium]